MILRIRDSLFNFKLEVKLLLNLLIIAFTLLVFIFVAHEVKNNNTKEFDYWVLNSIRMTDNTKTPEGSLWLNILMTDITALGGAAIIVLVTLAMLVYLLLKKNYPFLWMIIIATIGGALISIGFKELFSRERPPIEYHLLTVTSLSFPSGHATMSSVVYLTHGVLLAKFQSAKKLKIYFILVAATLVFLIGISRIYLGVHYPTDVVAGWSIGIAWASLCWLITKYVYKNLMQKEKTKSSAVIND